MDTRTGQIHNLDDIQKMKPSERKFMKEMKLAPTGRQFRRRKIGRNEPCPCGSGMKFKKCCLVRIG